MSSVLLVRPICNSIFTCHIYNKTNDRHTIIMLENEHFLNSHFRYLPFECSLLLAIAISFFISESVCPLCRSDPINTHIASQPVRKFSQFVRFSAHFFPNVSRIRFMIPAQMYGSKPFQMR